MIFGFLPELARDAAHRRQVDEQRHAGEVLQHDARDDERDLVGARARSAASWRAARRAASVTFLPSQLRSTDSSTMRIETGRREIGRRRLFRARAANRTCRSRLKPA